MGLGPINPGDDPEEGNDGGLVSSATFTLDIPADFEGVPRCLKRGPSASEGHKIRRASSKRRQGRGRRDVSTGSIV